VSLFKAGKAVTLLDSHRDLAKLILAHLVADGTFVDSQRVERLLYLDIPEALRHDRYLPLNVLTGSAVPDDVLAEQIADAWKRAWPELRARTPTFENILNHSIMVLRANCLPLTALADLLTDTGYRNRLLPQVHDPQVARFSKDRMDQRGKEAPLMRESTLNRADLLTFSKVLRYSLSQRENLLDFRTLLDSNTSCLINLVLPSPCARRLLGCLLTVSLEQAALSRAEVPGPERQMSHHPLLDKFSQFTDQSEEALTRLLSETRKYRLFLWLAHQNWTQASDALKGALQDVGLEMVMKVGRLDAEYSARLFGLVNPLQVKHQVHDAASQDPSHPVFASLVEQ
jgi:hypothetical protein